MLVVGDECFQIFFATFVAVDWLHLNIRAPVFQLFFINIYTSHN